MAVSVATVLLLAALFAGDSVWTALAALLAAGGWSALALAGRAPQPGGGAVLLGVLLAIAAWAGLSVAWSVAPDRSWAELDRTLVFAAFLVVGLLLGASRLRAPAAGPPRRSSRRSVPRSSGRSPARRSRRSSPTAAGRRGCATRSATGTRSRSPPTCLLVLALWLAAVRPVARRRRGRERCSPTRPSSRSSWPRPAPAWPRRRSAVALWLWLARDRVDGARCSRSRPLLPGAAVAAWAFTPPGARRRRATRVPTASPTAPGSACCCSSARAVVVLAALELRRRPLAPAAAPARRPRARRPRASSRRSSSRSRRRERGPDRRRVPRRRGHERARVALGSLSSNNRLDWWGEALDIFSGRSARRRGREQLRGRAEALSRRRASAVTQPHSVPLQFLAGHGARRPRRSSLALVAAAAARCGRALPAARGRGAGRRRGAVDRSRPLARARARGLRLGLRRRDRARRSSPPACSPPPDGRRAARRHARWPPPRVAALALAAAVVGRHALAGRAERARRWAPRSTAATSPPPPTRPTRARSLDPLALEPLFARARVEEARRDARGRARDLPGCGAAPAREPGDLVRARPLRVPSRRPLLGVRPPERGLHARSGRPAVGRGRPARPGARVGQRAGNC